MKLYVKKIATCILGAFFMVGTLSGCSGSSVSSADYVKAVLDVAYCADDADGNALDMSKDDVEKAKDSCIEKEAEFLTEYFNMEDVSDSTKKSLEGAAEKIFSSAKYTVEEKGDKVLVTIEPLKVFTDSLQEYVDDFNVKKYVEADDSCTEEEFVDGVTKELEKSAEVAEYEKKVEIEIAVTKKDGKYTVSDEDLSAIDDAMFVY